MYDGDDEYTEWFSGARSRDYWLRGALMVLFYVILWLVRFVVLVLAAFQFGAAIVVGRPNERVKPFASQLATYMQELVAFVTWASEHRPYPLSPWPGATAAGTAAADDEREAAWEEEEEEFEEPFEPEPEPEPEEPEPADEPEAEPEPPKSAKARSAKQRRASSRKKGSATSGKAEANEAEDEDTPPRPDA